MIDFKKLFKEELSLAANKLSTPAAIYPTRAILQVARLIADGMFVCSKASHLAATQAEAALAKELSTPAAGAPDAVTLANSSTSRAIIPMLWLIIKIAGFIPGMASDTTELLLQALNRLAIAASKPLPKPVHAMLNAAGAALGILSFQRPEMIREFVHLIKNALTNIHKPSRSKAILFVMLSLLSGIKSRKARPALAPPPPPPPSASLAPSPAATPAPPTATATPKPATADSMLIASPAAGHTSSPTATASASPVTKPAPTPSSAAAKAPHAKEELVDRRQPIDVAYGYLQQINDNAAKGHWRAIQGMDLRPMWNRIEQTFKNSEEFRVAFVYAMLNIVKSWGWDLERNQSAQNGQTWDRNTQYPSRLAAMIKASRVMGRSALEQDLTQLQKDQFQAL